jgi:myo-inositol-1-phosphate synthase
MEAKMRVKSDIFGPWQEKDLDHQVRVMYTPFVGDEKRDVVEYTSLGFLSCAHTMLTYTRCMDSILCVPLMVDAAVWCDYFARHDVPSHTVARATAYLFKVPEGGAKGVDPGFHHQMQELEDILQETESDEAHAILKKLGAFLKVAVKRGIISPDQADSLHVLAADPQQNGG